MTRLGFGHGGIRHAGGGGAAAAVKQVSAFGVAFGFTAPRLTGRYASGEWWVLGPVTINKISPDSAVQASGTGNNGATAYTNRSVHGTMVNPGNRTYAAGGLLTNNTGNSAQGFDSLRFTSSLPASPTYNDAFNLDPGKPGGAPLTLTTGSVVKFVSTMSALPTQNRPAGSDMVVLTVVDAVPAPDAIRPGVSTAGSKASRIRLSDFNLGVFQNLPAPASAPDFATAITWVNRYHENSAPDHINNVHAKAINNHPEYAREVANNIHRALLCLHLASFTADQKRQMLIGLATIGEDIVSRAEENGITPSTGGATQFKLSLLAVLAASLGPKTPAAWSFYLDEARRAVWSENNSLFRVTPFDVAQPRRDYPSRQPVPYATWMVGSVEFTAGGTGATTLDQASSAWRALYRDNVANAAMLPGGVAVQLTTGARALWTFTDFWLYFDSCFANRNDFDPGNGLMNFCQSMVESYRTTIAAAPAIVETGVRGDSLWLRCGISLNDASGVNTPPTSAFTVLVNGTPRTVTAAQVWRQNVGLTLASAVAGTDVVTVSYAVPGSSPITSVDGVNLASFTGRAVTNRTELAGGTNTAFPVVNVPLGTRRRTVLTTTLAPANNARGTLALLRFRFAALPTANAAFFTAPSGSPPVTLTLLPTGRIQFGFRNPAGTGIVNVRSPVLTPGTYYDILVGLDVTQTTGAAGMNCYVNGSVGALAYDGWVGGAGALIGWNNNPGSGFMWAADNLAFDIGALWLDTTTRVDITSAAERAKFAAGTIGSRGEGVTGQVPAQFHVGNAAQWNDDFGMNRGSGAARFYPNLGSVNPLGTMTAVSGSAWV